MVPTGAGKHRIRVKGPGMSKKQTCTLKTLQTKLTTFWTETSIFHLVVHSSLLVSINNEQGKINDTERKPTNSEQR